ncbi:hypothetical protein ES707_09818 [subsurface metagenome]
MNVTLVTNVPDDLIPWAVKYPVQSDGKLNHAQVGSKVTTGNGNGVNQLLPEFTGKLFELTLAQLL